MEGEAATLGGNDEGETDLHEPPGTDGQMDDRLCRNLDGTLGLEIDRRVVESRVEEGVWRDSPRSLWEEIMRTTGEDVDYGKLPFKGLFPTQSKKFQ